MTTENQSPATSNEENNFNKSTPIATVRSAKSALSNDKASSHFKTLSLRPTKSIKKKSSARPIRKIK